MTVDKWERRQLCENGACTGLIGSDGTCKVCGQPAPDFGDLRKPGRVSSRSEVDEEPEEDDDETEAPVSPAKVAAKGTVAAWNERRLCSDGACVGLLGDDGSCKVCGKSGGEAIAESKVVDDEQDDGEDEEDGEEDEDDEEEDEDAEVAQDDEDEDDDDDDDEGDRKLCEDGTCIGVIGANNKCKVCGKEAA